MPACRNPRACWWQKPGLGRGEKAIPKGPSLARDNSQDPPSWSPPSETAQERRLQWTRSGRASGTGEAQGCCFSRDKGGSGNLTVSRHRVKGCPRGEWGSQAKAKEPCGLWVPPDPFPTLVQIRDSNSRSLTWRREGVWEGPLHLQPNVQSPPRALSHPCTTTSTPALIWSCPAPPGVLGSPSSGEGALCREGEPTETRGGKCAGDAAMEKARLWVLPSPAEENPNLSHREGEGVPEEKHWESQATVGELLALAPWQ